VLARFPIRQRAPSTRLALIPIASSISLVIIVRCRVACAALYTSPSCVVVVPRVIKKSQESGEDEASSVVFTKCATKSSNILHDSSSIRQNFSVKEKIFNN
jgi:hypothetical protein